MRITPILAAVTALLTVGAAQATTLTIDDFNSPYVSVYDTNPGAASAQVFAAGAASTGVGAGNLANNREIFTNWSGSASATNTGGTRSSVAIGPLPGNDPEGALNINNGVNQNSVTTLTWSFPAGVLAAAVAGQTQVQLFIDVLASDTGQPPVDTRVDFVVFDGTTSFSLPAIFIDARTFSTPGQVYYSAFLGASQIAALTTPGAQVIAAISGQTGFDVSFDSVGLVIPEPTSLALAGLALVGAGVAASRRRKA